MTFSMELLAQSLAQYLGTVFPGVTFYEDPNQQGTQTPCLFLQQRYGKISPKTGGRFYHKIGLDLTYLLDYNRPDLQQRYQAAAETLDRYMETFPYQEGEESALLRTYDREWRIDLDALHYKFELRVWEGTPLGNNPMRTLEHHEEVIDGTENL